MSKSSIEVKHALLSYFTQEDTIRPDKDFALVKFDCDNENLKKALIKDALQELEKVEIVRPLVFQEDNVKQEWWVLVKPLALFEKQINFSCETAIGLADAINGYFKAAGKPNELTDPMNLKERDLQKLALIVESLMPKAPENS